MQKQNKFSNLLILKKECVNIYQHYCDYKKGTCLRKSYLHQSIM